MNKDVVFIYALLNPINNNVFYIGATKDINGRLNSHIHSKQSNLLKCNEIKNILSAGLLPEMIILDECNITEVNSIENFYIDLFRYYGFNLLQGMKSNYSEKIKIAAPFYSATINNGITIIKLSGCFMDIACESTEYVSPNDNISAKISSLYNRYYERLDFILSKTNSKLKRDGFRLIS